MAEFFPNTKYKIGTHKPATFNGLSMFGKAYQAAIERNPNMQKIPVDKIIANALVENRDDFGYNSRNVDFNSKSDVRASDMRYDLADRLGTKNLDNDAVRKELQQAVWDRMNGNPTAVAEVAQLSPERVQMGRAVGAMSILDQKRQTYGLDKMFERWNGQGKVTVPTWANKVGIQNADAQNHVKKINDILEMWKQHPEWKQQAFDEFQQGRNQYETKFSEGPELPNNSPSLIDSLRQRIRDFTAY